jgi:membrane-bound lytic murein transglycosylase D
MMRARRLIVASITGLLVGCGAHVRPAAPIASPPSLPVRSFAGLQTTKLTLPDDPISMLIVGAEREFALGESELKLGHQASAREHFDAAVDLLMEAPDGARGDARLSAEFDRLVDRISALDALEMRAGDGFSEAKSEPAAIDDLLNVATFERPEKPTATTAELVTQDLAATPHDLKLTINDKVLSYIELFQGNLHSFMEDGLERASRYLPMVVQVFKEEAIPLDLAYVPLVESAFKPTALSKASAKGLWQFELGTAKDEGLSQNWFVDERSDPEKATRAAASYFKTLRDLFDGDWNLALASYNAGMGRVQRAMQRARLNDYWDLTANSKYLPRETREYVPMIYAAIIIGRNPSHYGFNIDAVEPLAYETVSVPDALSLSVVAEWLDVAVERIQGLNPELRRGMTPRGQHPLKVPVGMASSLEHRLATAPPSVFAAANFHWYSVRRGETLATIARKYKTTAAKLAAANDLKPSTRLKGGTTLIVPIVPASALASRPSNTRATANASAATRSTYKVRPGDSLYGIARQFNLSVDDLKRLNQLSSNTINVGDTLTVRR